MAGRGVSETLLDRIILAQIFRVVESPKRQATRALASLSHLIYLLHKLKGWRMSQAQDLSLTEKIYQFIETYIAEKGISPSLREIALACGGLSLSTVTQHLDRLEGQGRVFRSWYKSRSLRLLKGTKTEDELSEDVYAVIVAAFEEEGMAPSQREIATACHISKTAVQRQLQRLEDQGRIRRGEGHRNLQLVPEKD